MCSRSGVAESLLRTGWDDPEEFRYLKVSLAVVLMVVGAKMMTHVWLKTLVGQHFNLYLLAVVLLILAAGVGASLLASRRERAREDPRETQRRLARDGVLGHFALRVRDNVAATCPPQRRAAGSMT